ncbi:esterase-like [Corylus avellana]|uniref:esterase-like n=1 Tax=Corylus avellana TaxID=13451 RepID=UPI00286C6F12|nr:esterase-like [Corylus avellana]
MIRCPAFLPFQTSSSLLGFLSICISRFVSPNMESPIILNYFTISVSCFCMILLYASTLNPVFALENCTFPAIFNLGDSNSDTGGLAAALITPTPPYGETFFHMPAGRFSDGRLIIDFMAKSVGLPYLSAYLDSLGTNFKHGANFATAASTIRLPAQIIPGGGFSPFYLNIQYSQFVQFKSKSQTIREKGGIYANLMPKKDYFPKALYTFDIGQNDLGEGFFGNMTIEEVNASVPDIVNNFSTNVKAIYDLGGRSFWIHNTGPIGCLPYILANFLSAQRDSHGCAKPYNDVAQYFNYKLKEVVVQLRIDLPLAAITHVDVYFAKYSLFSESNKHGFELPLVACCGYGGKYNYSSSVGCGGTITVNGSQIFVGSCERPSVRVNWDGIHYTEAANKFVFDKISTGAFSDPPIPLKMACHRV